MTRTLPTLAAAAWLTACAGAGTVTRCPTPAAPSAAAATDPPTVADDPLRARLPAETFAALRVDLNAMMRSDAIQVAWPLVIWNAEFDAVRAACGERLWEPVRELSFAIGAFEQARDPTGLAALAAGPVAEPDGSACAAALMRMASASPRTVSAPGGSAMLLAGTPGAVERVSSAVQGASRSMRESASFAGMTPSLRDARATLLVDLVEVRERFPGVFQSRDVPLAELSPQLLSARSFRAEVADADGDRSLLRWTSHFATPAAAEQARDTERSLAARGLPALVQRALEQEFAAHPHRDQMLAAMSRAYSHLAESMLVPRVVGADLVYETRFDAITAAATLGVLAAVAAPAFTRYERAEKAAEARTHVTAIARAVVAHWDAQPRARRRLIGAIPRTPPLTPSRERLRDPAGTWDAVPWQALGFRLDAPHYYVYDVQSDGRTTFTVRAQGDLDGDGTLSTYAITGHVGRDGNITLDEMRVENELE